MAITFPTTSCTIFGSGPATVREGATREKTKADSAPGVNGQFILTMGGVPEPIVVSGWVTRVTSGTMIAYESAAKTYRGSTGTLTDTYGRSWGNCTLSMVEWGERKYDGTTFHRSYRAVYLRSGSA